VGILQPLIDEQQIATEFAQKDEFFSRQTGVAVSLIEQIGIGYAPSFEPDQRGKMINKHLLYHGNFLS
jgi:hypothetical protein